MTPSDWILVAVLLAVAALVALGIVRHARRFAPVHRHDRIASGVGGAMYVFIFGQALWFLRAMLESPYMVQQVLAVVADNPEMATAALVVLAPTLLALILCPWMLWELAHRRAPSAPAVAVVCLWVLGPCVAALQSWYFDAELTVLSQVQLFGWAFAWTAYFAWSPRVALTYGTARAKALLAEAR